MELSFSTNYLTKITFRESFFDLISSLCADSCFIIDKSLEYLGKSFPPDLVFYLNGEKEKDLNHLGNCLEWLIDCRATRKTKLVVIGGGATTDFGAFAASIFNRGMGLILVPTTILAAVDSSIGGKTALNFVAKNMIGTFYPAEEVIVVKDFFKALNDKTTASGKAEIVKIALIRGGELAKSVVAGEDVVSDENLKLAIESKYKITRDDFTDSLEKRAVLNWGHTFGHAIEICYALPHGLAVAAGMQLAQEWAKIAGARQVYPADKLKELLQRHGIYADVSKYKKEDKWRKFIMLDKKRNLEKISMVYLQKIGAAGIIYRNLNDILRDLEELR